MEIPRVPPADTSTLRAFGVSATPERVPGGEERTLISGDVVLKAVDDEDEAVWCAQVLSTIEPNGFRVARPILSNDGRCVVDGWTAYERLSGRHAQDRWDEVIAAGIAFHSALTGIGRPEFIDRRTDPWSIGDRVAWGETTSTISEPLASQVDELLSALGPCFEPAQVIHGDLTNNVLFEEGFPPAIIDFTPYHRPMSYASAIVVFDALTYEGADLSILDGFSKVANFESMLARAAIYRLSLQASPMPTIPGELLSMPSMRNRPLTLSTGS